MKLYNRLYNLSPGSSSPISLVSPQQNSGLCGLAVDCYKPGISEELATSLTPGADVCITAAQGS